MFNIYGVIIHDTRKQRVSIAFAQRNSFSERNIFKTIETKWRKNVR